jgi:hypothetical protein
MRSLISLILPALLLAGCGREVPAKDEPRRGNEQEATRPDDPQAREAKLEDRVSALEQEVGRLKAEADARQPPASAPPNLGGPLVPPMLPPQPMGNSSAAKH